MNWPERGWALAGGVLGGALAYAFGVPATFAIARALEARQRRRATLLLRSGPPC